MVDDQEDMRQLDSHPQPSMQQQMHSMQPYNSNGHHTPEPYRNSPSQHHPQLQHVPPLPPIHQFEGSTMQSQPPYVPSPMNGAQMQPHPQQYNPHQFQYQNGAMQPAPMPSSVAVNGQNGMMRFPIPPQGPMPMGHARGAKNKEVKRRTKTGCLTCRKRRIKCDETHPTCRNCAKSKRECMGYDPIFKQQPGPAPIQPAPTSATTTPSQKSAPSSATLPSNAYQPSPSYPGTGGTFIAAGGNLIPSGNQSHGVDGPFEYGPSLDPALSGSDAALTMAANSYSSTLQPARPVKHISIDQLFSLNDVPPQYQEREAPPPGSMPSQKEVDDYYRYHYAPGLDKVFETSWYSTRGLNHLQQDPSLLDYAAQCMERMQSQSDDMMSINACKSLEARLVWKFASMPRFTPHPNGINGVANDQLTADLLPRIDTIEALLTGQFLPQSRMPPPVDYRSDEPTQDRQTFWHHLGRFTSIRDDTSDPEGLREINDTLAILRGILRGMENRDVLYSMAIARYIGGRLIEYNPPHRVQAQTDDPNDDVKKLQVAHDFVSAEDKNGTTQVIQRVCGMAIRSWILQKQ